MIEAANYFPRRPRSPNSNSRDKWPQYEGSFAGYLRHFENDSTKSMLSAQISAIKSASSIVALDLMSSTMALRTFQADIDVTSQFSGLSVSLTDKRTAKRTKEDKVFGVDQLSGNLSCRSTWDDIQAWLSGRKVNLLISMGWAGLHFIPTRQLYYGAVFNKILDLLDPNLALMMVQTPPYYVLEQRGINIESALGLLEESGFRAEFIDLSNSLDKYGGLVAVKNTLI